MRGVKYLAREMRDLEARLARQCACVRWGMSEDAFLCSSAMADEDDVDVNGWQMLSNRLCGDDDDGAAHLMLVPDYGCRVVEETMEFALEKYIAESEFTTTSGRMGDDNDDKTFSFHPRLASAI